MHKHTQTTPDLPDDVVLSVRNVSKKFCRNLKRSMWYGMQDLAANLVGRRPGRDYGPRPALRSLGEVGTTDYRPEDVAEGDQQSDLPQSVVRGPSSVVSPPTDGLRPSEFWALRDISFDLRRGECLGLSRLRSRTTAGQVGRNGAGKTTLLRLLTGIFSPDQGEIAIRGRVGALIALGAGFHPHMTGRGCFEGVVKVVEWLFEVAGAPGKDYRCDKMPVVAR